MQFYFLLSLASTADVSQVWPGMDQSFTKEVEDEANSYFQRIYNHPPNPTISIDEVLDMLKKFKDSPVKKERVSQLKNITKGYTLHNINFLSLGTPPCNFYLVVMIDLYFASPFPLPPPRCCSEREVRVEDFDG